MLDESGVQSWLSVIIKEEGFLLGDINYIFCSDTYLHDINLRFLKHDTFTDIISFDYTLGKTLHGDIYISVDRVKDNAIRYEVSFAEEMSRVMAHGLLHYCGYMDKSVSDKKAMRDRENHYLSKRLS